MQKAIRKHIDRGWNADNYLVQLAYALEEAGIATIRIIGTTGRVMFKADALKPCDFWQLVSDLNYEDHWNFHEVSYNHKTRCGSFVPVQKWGELDEGTR